MSPVMSFEILSSTFKNHFIKMTYSLNWKIMKLGELKSKWSWLAGMGDESLNLRKWNFHTLNVKCCT